MDYTSYYLNYCGDIGDIVSDDNCYSDTDSQATLPDDEEYYYCPQCYSPDCDGGDACPETLLDKEVHEAMDPNHEEKKYALCLELDNKEIDITLKELFQD